MKYCLQFTSDYAIVFSKPEAKPEMGRGEFFESDAAPVSLREAGERRNHETPTPEALRLPDQLRVGNVW
jgi:hypothetical protein